MNFPWAICLAREDGSALAALRLVGGIEVGEDGDWIWLRGRRTDERLEARLSALPARERHEWLPSHQLRPLGRRIPAAQLPDLHWQPLDNWLRVEMPAAAIPAALPATVPLRLVRCSREQEPELLLTNLEELGRFAANDRGETLVCGRPLPPLPGRRFVVHAGVAVPAGFAWEPAVGAEVLARHFGVSEEALLVWSEDGTVARLHSEQFVPLTRSALRETRQALADFR
ncbi:MAG: hypothetical protein P8Y53_21960 [Pseudolabrys sp.]